MLFIHLLSFVVGTFHNVGLIQTPAYPCANSVTQFLYNSYFKTYVNNTSSDPLSSEYVALFDDMDDALEMSSIDPSDHYTNIYGILSGDTTTDIANSAYNLINTIFFHEGVNNGLDKIFGTGISTSISSNLYKTIKNNELLRKMLVITRKDDGYYSAYPQFKFEEKKSSKPVHLTAIPTEKLQSANSSHKDQLANAPTNLLLTFQNVTVSVPDLIDLDMFTVYIEESNYVLASVLAYVDKSYPIKYYTLIKEGHKWVLFDDDNITKTKFDNLPEDMIVLGLLYNLVLL